MQWRRRRRVLVVVGAAQRALLLRGLQLVTDDDDERLEAAERRWLESPKVRAVRELIQRFQVADDDDQQDDGSEDEESRDEERGGRERHWKPRPRFHQHHQGQHGTYGPSASGQEKRTFNEDEYTRITTPRQDVLFKKGYLGRKRPTTADPASNGSNGLSNGASTNGSANGDGTLHNGESLDADCGDGSDMMDDQAYYYPGAFVDPATGMYYVNGGYEMYDPYTGAVTVVVGPGPGMMGLPPMGLPPIEFFNPRLPPPPHGPPPHMAPMQSDYCYMHGRKRFSVDSQVSENCSGPSSESAGSGSGPPSGPPSSPQECDSGGLPSGPSPGPPPGPLPPMGPLPYPPHPHYMYPYMFGAPLYSLDGVSVQGGPPYGPICDVNAVSKRRKKKRRRKRRRGVGTDDGSEESSSEDNQLEEGEGAGLSSLSSQSAEDSQATPTDSDAFPEFVPKAVDPATVVAASTLNGDASAWEPSILTPPQTPTACALTEHKESPVVHVQPTEAVELITSCSAADELPAAEDAAEQPKLAPSEVSSTSAPEERPEEAPAPAVPEETPAQESSPPSAVETVEKSAEPSPATVEAKEIPPLAETAAEAHSTPCNAAEVICEATPVPVKEPQPAPEPLKEVEAIAKVKNGVKQEKHSAPKVNGEVLCVSKKAVDQSSTPLVNGKEEVEFKSSLTLPVEKVPVCNGEVICFKGAVESNPETVLSQCIDISGDTGKDKSVQRTETLDVILNNNNDLKQKGKVNQNRNAVNDVTVKGDKIVSVTNGKVKKVRNNSSPDHQESNGFAEKSRLSESPSRDEVSEVAVERGKGDKKTTPAQTKNEPTSRTKEAKSAKRKAKKGAPAKTDLSSKAGGVNGAMASTPPPPGPLPADPTPKPTEGAPDDLGFSLRPEPSIAWGRRNETKVRPVDDVLLQALVGSVQSAPQSAPQSAETKVDIPVELETPVPAPAPSPAPAPVAPRLEAEAEAVAEPAPVAAVAEPQTEPKGSRLTPSSAHRHSRAKKWRQKERAPTPGRELTASSSSLSSSDEADEGETVIFVSPLAATATTTTTAPAVEQAEQRESPLRITEAVTAWLRDHESEEVLVPAVEHAAVSDSESETDDAEDDGDDENAQPPKNAIGNPFRASSHSSTTSTTPAQGHGADVEERVASLDEPEAAWDTLCDPSLFVAKYYRLGDDPQDSMPAVVALELRPDLDLDVKHQRERGVRSSVSPEKGLSALCDQHDSGVHSDESGDEHHTPTKDMQAQAEEFAAKSAYLLRQLKGQSPGVPCGGICCSLQ
ncbi:Protein lifeguard 1 [Frankliniella fusca]|uniref:Protein lifeguard 1 n=1 Tax=Frankliniella fusca TaxID=407009 RepID=A0AAE1HIQ9_9NEOP|nr:Protein lifeguard 1 [Frankliniella fusca]